VARPTYEGAGYAHQGWLTEDHAWFFLDDEADEAINDTNTRTLVWDVSDLDQPFVTGAHFSSKPSVDHNQYVRGELLFQSNYTRGLQVLRILDPSRALLREVARFDTHPEDNAKTFNGTWSVYPYLPSGALLLNDRNRGLFVLGLRLR
jgi:choice-of-anchor B domain-containing protein